ncbi:MAG: hypothetical protein IT243_06135 [Bacteroidia bacterium]|nr:hypothetical protein [Bacteroidia bacterium]
MSNEKKIRSFNRSRDKEDIVKDKNFRALKPGKRISEEGNVYYENRPNRSDIAPRQKLAEGGVINEKKIASIEAEIAEYEMLLDDSSVPADEKKFAKSEIADLKEKIKSLNKKKAKSFKKSDKKLKHFKVIKSTKRGKSKAKSFKTTAKKIRSFNRCRDKSDIAKDKNIRALKPGKRISKRGWKNQYGTSKGGKTYYENRPNRSDIAPRQKLAEGGVINEITAKDAIIQYGINNLSEGVGVNKYGSDLHICMLI